MSSGDYKCLRCQTEELRERIVKVTPNSQRAKEIIAEDNRYNDYAQCLNKSAGYEIMKLKKGRYQ